MPIVFNAGVLASSLAELLAALFAAAVALSFRRAFPRGDLPHWGAAWAAGAAFALLSLAGNAQAPSPGQLATLRAVARTAAYLQAAWFLVAAQRLAGAPSPAWVARLPLAAPLLGVGTALASTLELSPLLDAALRALASCSVGAAALAAAFWIRRGRSGARGLGTRLMSAGLALFGVLKLFSPATLSQLGLVEGSLAGPALFAGFALFPTTFALGAAVSLVEDRERVLAAERDRLRVSEELFRAVVEDQTEMIVRWKPDGTRTFVNEAYCRVFGGSASDHVGTSFLPLVAEEYRQRVHEKIRALTPAEPVATHVHESLSAAGARRWQEWTDRGIFDGSGRLLELQSTGRDITEQRVSERLLREGAERLRRMSEATFEGISITEDGVILDVNEQFARIHGYPVEVLLGRPVTDLVAPEDRPRVIQAIAQQLTAPYEVVGLRKDGSTFPVSVQGRPLELGERRLRVTAVRDMSEQRALSERLALVGRASNDAVWDWDLQSGKLWWSEGIHTLFGYAQRDVQPELGWWSERIHPDERERVRGGLEAAVAEGRHVWSDEYRFQRADGGYADVLDRGFVLRGRDGAARRMVGAMLDVTERKRVQDALHRSQRMATVGALVAGVAHEVRTPLFGISAGLDAYEAQLRLLDWGRELAELLRFQVERLSALMHDLLDYGRPPALRLGVGGIEAPLRRALQSCSGSADRAGVALSVELGTLPFELDRDANRLEQVFENLLSNAIHHSRRGGSVRVSIGARDGPNPAVTCSVSDEGPGIQPEDLARVFEPFFSRRKGGTGLGLAIVRQIVEEHGGTVRAENRPEGGAVFTVLLPARRVQAA